MTPEKTKTDILKVINSFSEGNVSQKGIALFKALGYVTDRQANLENPVYEEFRDNYILETTRFNETNALVAEWMHVDILFQLSKEEVLKQTSLFDTKQVDRTIIETYLFITIELSRNEYTRTQLSQITREVNRIFPMPVLILFKYSNFLTLSVINRRLHKRDDSKDVLEKVTQIKDIHIDNPHRAHIEILFDLSFDELKRQYRFTNFVELHNAWQKTLDIKELNKKFYNELFNWYLWAMGSVCFPNDVKDDKDDKVFNAESVIRLLTRLIFVWFIKEKKLVPDTLFDVKKLKNILAEFNPLSNDTSVYYRAILQNLFFATLNTPMDNDINEENIDEKRQFLTKTIKVYSDQYLDQTKYRYKEYFKSPDHALELFATIPFLNGGLFECLDFKENGKEIRYDGFSTKDNKQAFVADKLFFAEEFTIDLNAEYGTTNKKYKVEGLINILNSYKFTITENTPLEEEIALDPELLGKVFENLLASYNPETQSSARKQTGSYYTPREIVNYMVDESLIAYLKKEFENTEEAELKLRNLFTQPIGLHKFSNSETDMLIKAISNCKILDPACGSGAFPMGILHRLVDLLSKLDPHNEKWNDLQIERAIAQTSEVFKSGDASEREIRLLEINKAFDMSMNHPDYARKLFLIENCIYGVDIQHIAIQISKLRFFISLMVDQKVDDSKPNRNILSMPNLETKFVAANTLIGLDKPKNETQLSFIADDVTRCENELTSIRHKIFFTRKYTEKKVLKQKEEAKRKELEEALNESGYTINTASKMAGWNPFDPIKSASFFDTLTMFGFDKGFDLVIGNPPYVRADNPAIAWQRELIMKSKQYDTLWEKWDLMVPFFERGLKILVPSGVLTYIVSNSINTSKYAEKLQDWIIKDHFVRSVDYFENVEVFEAGVIPVILSLQSFKKETYTKKVYRTNQFDNIEVVMLDNDTENLKSKVFRKSFDDIFSPNINAERLGDICYLSYGLRPNSDEKLWKGEFTAKDVISDIKSDIFCKEYVEGKQINRFGIDKVKYIEWGTERIPKKLVRPTFPDLYTKEKLFLGVLTGATFDNKEIICNHSIVVAKRFSLLKNINERSISVSISKNNFEDQGSKTSSQVLKRRFELEKISEKYDIKYILAIINSSYAIAFMNNYRRHRLENYFYPDDFRNYPIPVLDLSKQMAFVALADYMLFLRNIHSPQVLEAVPNEHIAQFVEKVINGCVFELYFKEHMNEKEIDIFQFVEAEIQPIAGKLEIEAASIIKNTYELWREHKSQVRNRLLLFSTRSQDIILKIENGK
jgi:adenine-specific DNA-methyltransferase